MSRWVALLAIVLAGCTQQSGHPVGQATVSASVFPTAAGSPSPTLVVSPTPVLPPSTAPFVDLPLAALDFRCRLPIVWADAQINDIFISFPERTESIDPSGHGFYFDRAFSRWLPVSGSAVSPDGSKYASIEPLDTEFLLHVVDVSSGKETLVHLSTQLFTGQPYVFDYSSDGIYLVQVFEHLSPGLWLVDPVTGLVRQISKDLYPIYTSGNGVIWTQAINPEDPHPVVSGTSLGTLPDEIDRVDLRSGTRTEWLYKPGKWVSIIGLDSSGIPLMRSTRWDVGSDDPDGEVLLVAAANSEKLIYKGPVSLYLGGGMTDAHGIWIGTQRGIYLFTSGGVIEKVSDHPGSVANSCF